MFFFARVVGTSQPQHHSLMRVLAILAGRVPLDIVALLLCRAIFVEVERYTTHELNVTSWGFVFFAFDVRHQRAGARAIEQERGRATEREKNCGFA